MAVRGVSTIDLKLTPREDRANEKRAACPLNKEEFN